MARASDYSIIYQMFANGWSTTDIAWPGYDFTPPSEDAWVQFNILSSIDEQMELGQTPAFWSRGRVEVNIFVPIGEGEARIWDYADTIAAIFRGKYTENLVFREPEVTTLGRSTPDPYLQVNVSVPFYGEAQYAIGDVAVSGYTTDSTSITQASHGFSQGDWVGFDGSSWSKAKAASGSEIARGVVAKVTNSSVFKLATGGLVTLPTHGLTLGTLYLSQGTAGAATSSQGTSGIVQELGVAIDADTVLVRISTPQVV